MCHTTKYKVVCTYLVAYELLKMNISLDQRAEKGKKKFANEALLRGW